MIGWLIAAVLLYCVIRSPGTVLLLVALGRGGDLARVTMEKTTTPTICSRKSCAHVTADPKQDGWHWLDLGPDTTLTSGWWCPGCNARLIEFMNRMVAAGDARLDCVVRRQ